MSTAFAWIEARALPGLPEIQAGDDLARLIAMAAREAGLEIAAGDVLVVAQKVVSKAEGRVKELSEVTPSELAVELAGRLHKDARLVELVLAESAEVVRAERGVLIVRTRNGLVCANAGIDGSNVAGERVTLLPEDPDASARRIRLALRSELGSAPAVVVADSFGRAWRIGQTDVAIGCAGMQPLDDRRGERDALGNELTATLLGTADEAAAAAALVRDKAGRDAVVVIRGLDRFVSADDGPGAAAIQRPPEEDLFG